MKCRLPRANIQCFVDGHFFLALTFFYWILQRKKSNIHIRLSSVVQQVSWFHYLNFEKMSKLRAHVKFTQKKEPGKKVKYTLVKHSKNNLKLSVFVIFFFIFFFNLKFHRNFFSENDKNNFCIWMLRMEIFFFRFKNAFLAEAQQFKINICSNKTTWNKSCLIWNNAYTIHMKWSSNNMKKKRKSNDCKHWRLWFYLFSKIYSLLVKEKHSNASLFGLRDRTWKIGEWKLEWSFVIYENIENKLGHLTEHFGSNCKLLNHIKNCKQPITQAFEEMKQM